MKLLKAVILFALVGLFLGETVRIDLFNDIAVKPLDLICGINLLVVVILSVKNKRVPITKITSAITIFVVIALASLFVNNMDYSQNQLFTSSLYLLRWASYVSIYFTVSMFDIKFKKLIIYMLIACGFMIVFIGYIQYFLYPNLRNLYYLGWDEHNYRMFSIFLDPNFAGAYFVLFSIFMTGIMQYLFRIKQYKGVYAAGTILILTVIATFLTYSRSAIVMLCVYLITYLAIINKKRFYLFFLILFTLILMLLSPTFNKENTNLLRKTSSYARVETYKNSFTIIKDHPFLGVGFNTYRYAQYKYGFRSSVNKFPSHADAGTDNSFLFVTSTTGIIGLAAYLYMYFKIMMNSIIEKSKKNTIMPIVIFVSILSLSINAFFINSLFFPEIMLWVWIVAGSYDTF